MKVLSVKISNFKQFKEREWDFSNQANGHPKKIILIEGPNGAGKTTLLQAIALVLGRATGRLKPDQPLPWAGFDETLAGTQWRRPIHIEIKLSFEQEELEATRKAWEYLKYDQPHLDVPPAMHSEVLLIYENGKVWAKDGADALFQCKGRSYARQLKNHQVTRRELFNNIGYPFWYTDIRTHTSFTGNKDELILNEDHLRDMLTRMSFFHRQIEEGSRKLSPGFVDLYKNLQDSFSKIFPLKKLVGPAILDDIDQVNRSLYNLSDGRCEYEISEMSGAEKAIFPILFDFVNWNLNYSVILIDEIELHLHPPIQQRFLRVLPELGKNNQLILTTHSRHVSDLVSSNSIFFIGADK